ncbi:glycosyltransferase [Nocardioides psychrotolerans]|uniref:glycosyltransferase n=1 Tax=Nocardioides psychrotolerans TaxID=1005945 RepID=UPI00313781E0
MKIVQVLTYVSVDNAYGGPVAVAKVQCRVLAQMGHEVHLLAGWDGRAVLEIPGVRVHLHRVTALPRLGFAGMLSLGLWRTLLREARGADVVHFHFARDLVQVVGAALMRSGRHSVLQAHGMVRPDSRLLARALDCLVVRRIYRNALCHLALTEEEVMDAHRLARQSVDVVRVRNAVPMPEGFAAWDGETLPVVVFSARLHARKRPVEFVQMAAVLLKEGRRAQFRLFGPDAGELTAVKAEIDRLGVGEHVSYVRALQPGEVSTMLLAAHVYVLPSVAEPFPMSLLEALAAGLPSVITDKTGLSEELSRRGSAVVTDGSVAEMASAVGELISHREAWSIAAAAARSDAAAYFSPEALGVALQGVYAEL